MKKTHFLLASLLLCVSLLSGCKKDDSDGGGVEVPECPVVMPCMKFGCNVSYLNTYHNSSFAEHFYKDGYDFYGYGNPDVVPTRYSPLYFYFVYNGHLVISAGVYPESVFDSLRAYLGYYSVNSYVDSPNIAYEMKDGKFAILGLSYSEAAGRNTCMLMLVEDGDILTEIPSISF